MIDKTILNLKKLKSFHIHNGNYDPDIDRAIKAIEQQSNMVSRIAYEQVMWERDVAINQLKELGYGFGEKIKTDKDAISRQAALECFTWTNDKADIWNRIKKLPSVTPQPKTGHWIEDTNGTYTDNHDTWECSECGHAQILLEGTPKDNDYNYCPNCGAKMVEPQERSE